MVDHQRWGKTLCDVQILQEVLIVLRVMASRGQDVESERWSRKIENESIMGTSRKLYKSLATMKRIVNPSLVDKNVTVRTGP